MSSVPLIIHERIKYFKIFQKLENSSIGPEVTLGIGDSKKNFPHQECILYHFRILKKIILIGTLLLLSILLITRFKDLWKLFLLN